MMATCSLKVVNAWNNYSYQRLSRMVVDEGRWFIGKSDRTSQVQYSSLTTVRNPTRDPKLKLAWMNY